MRPTAHGRALEGIVRDLAGTRDGATYFAERLWGLSLHYERDERHPLVGCSAPDLQFEDGSRLAYHLHPGCGVLFDLAGDAPSRQAMTPWQGRIRTVSRRALDDLGLAALLVRPDGFVAWASDRQAEAGQVESAATRWFGLPDPVR